MRRRLTLVGVNLLLLAAIIWLMTVDPPRPPPTPPGKRVLASRGSGAPSIDAAIPASLQRPIFRPVTLPAEPSPPSLSQSTQPELRLVGVVLANRRVGFVERNGSKAQQIAEGDDIGGWTVKAIEARTLTLSRGGRLVTYHLDPPRSR